MTKSRGIHAPRRAWSDFELEVMRMHYPRTLNADLAELFSRTSHSVYHRAGILGLHKDPQWVADVARERSLRPDHKGRELRFKKGNVPWCAGTKGVVGVHENSRKTQFKARRPEESRNYIPIGGHRVNNDGYLDRKIRDDGPPQNRFERVHRLVWIEANGPIPDGHIVVFRDGRRSSVLEEITADRLECITNAEHLRRRSIHRLPPELAAVARLRGRLTRAIHEREETTS